MLTYNDPRMWSWNIRQMGVLDLPALVSRVLSETGFEKLGLVCHSQGTTETFVALAKEQRPDLGNKISVFCALAPAVYAGPLIGKMYLKFMRIISPGMFRIFFGIHAFIPFMMTMHSWLPGSLYGAMGQYCTWCSSGIRQLTANRLSRVLISFQLVGRSVGSRLERQNVPICPCICLC